MDSAGLARAVRAYASGPNRSPGLNRMPAQKLGDRHRPFAGKLDASRSNGTLARRR